MFAALLHWLFNFTSETTQLAAWWAIPTAVILAAGSYFWSGKRLKNTVITSLTGGLTVLYALKLWFYFDQPTFNGFLHGTSWIILFTLLLNAIIGGASATFWSAPKAVTTVSHRDWDRDPSYRSSRSDSASPFFYFGTGYAAVVALLTVSFIVWTMFTAWGTGHKQQLAGLAHVTVASKDDKLPDTDPNHIVMVSQAMAAYRGHQVIGSTGTNLGSIWKTDIADYTLQSVKGHLWWIAPLQIQSGWKKFMDSAPDSPGYIRVDAEDPNGVADVQQDFDIKLMPGSSYERQLERHLYMSGYTNVHLDDATIEVDDDWRPFYTVTAWKYAWASQGQVVAQVLLVNAQTGEIQSFAPDKVPAWVDRVMSESIVEGYLNDWGAWNDKRSTWPNFSNSYQQKPDGLELVYNTADKPVWIVPMTSNNDNDTSANGVIVYSTQSAKGTFYPGLSGIGVGTIVNQAFAKIPANTNNKMDVQSAQLYQIEGRPTWVAIYGIKQDNGTESFAGIGFVDAHSLDSANVQFANNRQDALSAYKGWIAGGGGNSGNVSSQGKQSTPVTGVIKRIGWNLVAGTSTYYISIVGDSHTFTVTSKVYDSLALVQAGDTVSLTYIDSKEAQEAVTTFSDPSVK